MHKHEERVISKMTILRAVLLTVLLNFISVHCIVPPTKTFGQQEPGEVRVGYSITEGRGSLIPFYNDNVYVTFPDREHAGYTITRIVCTDQHTDGKKTKVSIKKGWTW